MGICFHIWRAGGHPLSDTRPGLALSRFVSHEAIFIATVTRWAGHFFGFIGTLQSNLFGIPANATSMEPDVIQGLDRIALKEKWTGATALAVCRGRRQARQQAVAALAWWHWGRRQHSRTDSGNVSALQMWGSSQRRSVGASDWLLCSWMFSLCCCPVRLPYAAFMCWPPPLP